ncbi:AMP-activated protein kinase-like protein [Taibaiella chishuiensis]|uniref:AMP-activated protein kinase-like protein n=1 Tax=Taibaiella chishuiensis TaxID=1434707 RepID=A0A2P8D7Z2_9BACT|nr:AMP-activated protein kinase-like protein [Taibaiella chishuiensis]
MPAKPLLLLCLFLTQFLFPENAPACTIFLANSGKKVWIGNNEDESPGMQYRIWYMPRERQASGYMLWSEKHEGYDSLMWQYPQGGLNEHGLFMDYTAIDDIAVKPDPAKKDREQEVVNDILKSCRTVKQALQFISAYNLVKLSGAQLFIADASGDYATVHGNYVVTKTTQNFSLTNYCIAGGRREACWRRETATEQLDKQKAFRQQDITGILQATAQQWPGDVITNYSMAIDLSRREMILYFKGDFGTPVTINLDKALQQGKHNRDIADYFPANIAPVLKQQYATTGIEPTIALYNKLRDTAAKRYNFANHDALSFAATLLSEGKTDDALAFLDNLHRQDKDNILVNDWLGIAHHYKGNKTQAAACFKASLAKQPDDYLANLYQEQASDKVVFKLPEWTGAHQVQLIGDFTGWLKKPVNMKKKDGYWFAEVVIPAGQHQYKFLVDGVFYLADPHNLLYTWKGDNVNSLLLL